MSSDFLATELAPFIHQTLETWQVPGLALAVIRDDQVVHQAGYGLRNVQQRLPVTPDTLFPIASITKSFAVLSIGLLIDQGKLEWDTPVKDILPDWQMQDPYITQALTVRDMLTHRSGMPSHDWAWMGSNGSRRDLLARLRHLDFSAPLRTRFQYNNVLYMLSALVVETIAGMSWERFVQTRILDPLGMKRTNFSTLVSLQDPDHARPHVNPGGVIQECPFWEQDGENCVTGSAGTINSCASDLTRWLSLHMNGGKIGSTQFIQPKTLEAMHLPNIFIDDPQARERFGYEFTSYGMGWFLRSHKGQMLVSHGGSVNGFWSTLYFMPRRRLGIIALSNCDEGHNNAPAAVSLTIFDRLLNLPPTDWNALFLEPDGGAAPEVEASQPVSAPVSRPLEAYTGIYEHPGYGKLTLELVDGGLQMGMNDKRTFSVSHSQGESFIAHESTWNDRLNLTFAADGTGHITALAIPLEESIPSIIFTRRQTSTPSRG